MRSILAVGSDEGLLRTRVAVLERTKADVTHASPETALKLLATTPFDLVVLCHSVSLADTIRIADAAHRWADVYALQLVTGALWSPSYDGVPVDGICESEPTRLVQRVLKILPDKADQVPKKGKPPGFQPAPRKAS
jgi:hypothetical protein